MSRPERVRHLLSPIQFGVCLVCFFLSGLSALIYQTSWVRQLGLVFGASEIAVVAVLAGFMGGLALGAAIASRVAGRVGSPLLIYAVIEVAVAVFALLFPFFLAGVGRIQQSIFSVPTLAELPPAWQGGLLVFSLSFLLLLIPTALMGMTLPLLIRFSIREDREMGWKTAVVYAVNTAGAAGGALLSVFLLLPRLGLGGAVWVAAGINVLVAIAAFLLSCRGKVQPVAKLERVRTRRFHWVYPVVLVSGAVSFSGEVMWTRLLSQILGGTVYSFGTILAIFLVGLSIGSTVASRFVKSEQIARTALVWAQIGIATTLALGFLSLDPCMQFFQNAAGSGEIPYRYRLWLAVAALGPVACFTGATFPLAVRVAVRSHEEMASASAQAFSWNTVGAILGAIVAGVCLLPMLRYSGTVVAMICVCLGLGALVSCVGGPLRKASLSFCALGFAALFFLPFQPPAGALQFSILSGLINDYSVVFYRVGRTSNVLLYEDRSVGDWGLFTNGLPEATIQSKGNPRQWIPMARSLPLFGVLGTPDAKSMMVVGLGGGLAVESVPGSIKKIEVVELEPEVVAANRVVAEERLKDPLSDPRVRIRLEDARSALRLSEEKFDIVVSQPSHPFTSGSSHLYTKEFFELVQSRLRPQGSFVQWMGGSLVDEKLFLSLLASLGSVFENVEVYLPKNGGGVVFLARDSSGSSLSNVASVVGENREEFSAASVYLPEELVAAYLGGDATIRQMSKGMPLITDQKNLFQVKGTQSHETSMGLDRFVRWFAKNDPFDLAEFQGNSNRLVLEWLIDKRYVQAEAYAQSLDDSYSRNNAQGQIHLAKKQYEQARGQFEMGIKSDDARVREEAASGLFFSYQRALLRFDPEILREANVPLTYAATQAMERAKRGDWEAVGDLDGTLEKIDILHPLYRNVLTLRMTYASQTEQWAGLIDISKLPGRWPDSLAEGRMIAAAYARLEQWDRCLIQLSQLPKVIRRTENPPVAVRAAIRNAVSLLKQFPDEQQDLPRYRALLSNFEQLLNQLV
ncbi:MAG: hypothetical protein CMO55_07020 [Verrucomicrobiales bacterium]|nr:hypothetical protein [Verrucomicrobiales bacterium]